MCRRSWRLEGDVVDNYDAMCGGEPSPERLQITVGEAERERANPPPGYLLSDAFPYSYLLATKTCTTRRGRESGWSERNPKLTLSSSQHNTAATIGRPTKPNCCDASDMLHMESDS
ncbi:hypothetical protein OPV22_009693 [Ensete ventricosum]|uniref:Uncharacterized protein n=1 Tax=Ensete ventricosum TaxID=4639 RepID=A0AAV8R9F8_ENSVE|nr:hypothetical protein OPV22_009693 [Ensete ventricosum]